MLKLYKVLTIFFSPILFYVTLPALSQTLRQDEVGFFLFLIMNLFLLANFNVHLTLKIFMTRSGYFRAVGDAIWLSWWTIFPSSSLSMTLHVSLYTGLGVFLKCFFLSLELFHRISDIWRHDDHYKIWAVSRANFTPVDWYGRREKIPLKNK